LAVAKVDQRAADKDEGRQAVEGAAFAHGVAEDHGRGVMRRGAWSAWLRAADAIETGGGNQLGDLVEALGFAGDKAKAKRRVIAQQLAVEGQDQLLLARTGGAADPDGFITGTQAEVSGELGVALDAVGDG